VTLKQIKRRIGPGGGTRRLHHKHTDMTQDELNKLRNAYIKVYGNRWREVFAKYYWCVYDGAELGSTDALVDKWSCPDVSSVNANDNYNCK